MLYLCLYSWKFEGWLRVLVWFIWGENLISDIDDFVELKRVIDNVRVLRLCNIV